MSKPITIAKGNTSKEFKTVGKGGVSFSLACSVGTKDKPATDWYSVTAWRGQPKEFIEKFLNKSLFIEVIAEQSFYTSKEGEKRAQLNASYIQFMPIGGKKPEGVTPKEDKEPEILI